MSDDKLDKIKDDVQEIKVEVTPVLKEFHR
jgi:hypothetical protein